MIKIESVVKKYGQQSAVDGLTFEISDGQVVGLLGPNGAGKTTTMNIVTGVIFPDSGRVLVNGHGYDRYEREIKRQIGYLSENNPLYSSLLVYESLELAGELKGMSRSEFRQALPRVVENTGIGEVLSRTIDSLSKGFKQRVGLAQALINDPPILVLDEPTEGLDPNQRQDIRKLIRDLGTERTVLLSTHVMQEVEALCTHVVVINKGKIVARNTVEGLRQAQKGQVLIEIEMAGERGVEVLGNLGSHYGIEIATAQPSVFAIDSSQRVDFYQRVGVLTSDRAYLTRMLERQENLEEVFHRLTSEKDSHET